MDVRELYGASSLQRQDMLSEENMRLAHAALMSGMAFALPALITDSSVDGHNATIQPAVKRAILDPVTGQRSYEDHPIAPDTPIHYPGGGGTTLTHPVAQGDEGTVLYLSRQIDSWRQSGGSQQPIDPALNDPGDAVLIPGVRSDPRKLQQVSTEAAHLRSDDKRHVHEFHPTNGVQTFSADPSTAPASASFDPLASATKFFRHIVQGVTGIIGSAVSGGTIHSHGVDHDQGAWMSSMGSGGTNFARAHPVLGSLLSALNGAHSVTAGLGGVTIQSATSISMACPPGGLSLPAGSVSSTTMSPGAASASVGPLGGDLSGTLPNPQVTSILHVAGANALPVAANDAAAAALVPPVAVGSLYRNGSVLMVRVA